MGAHRCEEEIDKRNVHRGRYGSAPVRFPSYRARSDNRALAMSVLYAWLGFVLLLIVVLVLEGRIAL